MSHKFYKPARSRLQRSELAVPGSSPQMFEKALNSAADYIFLDLEDAVSPNDKITARANIIKALKNRTACLIANHGQVAFGENLEKTFELAQEIENICHQYINAIRIGIPKILSKKEMKIVLGKFKNYKKG